MDAELREAQAAVAVGHDGILCLVFVSSHVRDACVQDHQISAVNVVLNY